MECSESMTWSLGKCSTYLALINTTEVQENYNSFLYNLSAGISNFPRMTLSDAGLALFIFLLVHCFNDVLADELV
jgi:hypothetical protein